MTVGIDLRCLAEPYGSGVATYTRRMLTELVATAPDVRYVVFCSGIKAGRPQLPQGHIEYRQLRVPNRWLNLSFTLTGHPTIEQCFKAVDIVWQPNPLFIGTGTIPTWVTVHDLSGSRFQNFLAGIRVGGTSAGCIIFSCALPATSSLLLFQNIRDVIFWHIIRSGATA